MQEFGLSNTEAKVYLASLELGKSPAGAITKKSGVNRTNVYDALERLISKGLVSYIMENNVRLFEAVHPDRLHEFIEERHAKLGNLIQQLKKRYIAGKKEEDACIFRGKKGIKSIFEDILKEKNELLVYGAQSRFKEMFPYYQKHWNEERARLGFKVKMIYNESVRAEKKKEGLKLIEMRFLPETYDFPSLVMVFSNKVVNIVWTESPFAFQITSRGAVQSHTHFFNLLWKIAKK